MGREPRPRRARLTDGHPSDVAYNIEYGLETTRQSALNLVYLLAYQPSRHGFAVSRASDETFHIRGGNDQLPARVAATLPAGFVNLGWRLGRIAREPDGTWRLGFDGRPDDVADHVLLAIPFSVLRTLDYGAAGFDDLKRTAIEELGYGTNAKLALQGRSRPWRASGPWGISTVRSSPTWPSRTPGRCRAASRAPKASSSTTRAVTPGRRSAIRARQASPPRRAASSRNSSACSPGSATSGPGLPRSLRPRSSRCSARGSYACYLVGQYTRFGGIEGAPAGTCHFAGEHCSTDFQGYMEGAAVEGIRAAKEILHDLRRATM